jgi:hypothetical protein
MHGMPSDPNQWVGLFFLVFVFPLWLAGMGTFVYFWVHVAPSALQRWADDEGYQIIRRKNPEFRDWRSLVSNSGTEGVYGRVYRVIVRNKMGGSREGLVLVGGQGGAAPPCSDARSKSIGMETSLLHRPLLIHRVSIYCGTGNSGDGS